MKRNKGISLIVLVITIIVMTVLAGAIILTLNNSGIIEKAQNAVNATNESTVKEVASMAWAEAYANGARTEAELKAGVEAAFEKNKINTEDYIIKVTTNGVTVNLAENMWIKKGFTVVKGDQVLEIGDVINYDAGVSTYTAGWKVLGADEDGNLLILSAGSVKSGFRLGYEASMTTDAEKLSESIKDYETAVAQLNAECEPYGHGKGAIGTARSINMEDVDSVTGYVPETMNTLQGTAAKYGSIVTYKYNGTTKPAYSSELSNGALSFEHNNGFYYYNGDKVVHVNNLTTGISGEAFATLKSDYYTYSETNLTTISKTENEKAFSLVFGREHVSYWIATSYINLTTSVPMFGVYRFYVNSTYYYNLLSSMGTADYGTSGIRAVVTLSKDLQLTGSSETGWSY